MRNVGRGQDAVIDDNEPNWLQKSASGESQIGTHVPHQSDRTAEPCAFYVTVILTAYVAKSIAPE